MHVNSFDEDPHKVSWQYVVKQCVYYFTTTWLEIENGLVETLHIKIWKDYLQIFKKIKYSQYCFSDNFY
jgi:hypothetical protein